jgi:23S rRNA (cytidine1920-2'-O)/16S rRNA (cytidine1409-2'-O)-methyltransferase
MAKQRLDLVMVARGLAASREKAQALIMAGEVKLAGQKASKPGQTVSEEDLIEVAAPPPYVSRGGFKLAGALDHFGVSVEGRVCLDIGSSTGGFTDCLLQRGAVRVHAVDVGTNQLDWRIRSDPRVVVHENLNARNLAFEDIGELVGLWVCDVSFISVTLILPAALAMLEQPKGEMLILVKPQFEVGKGQVGKGGIVRDAALHEQACQRVEESVRAAGYLTAIMPSPILGTEGNKEFLLYGHH